MLIWVILGMIHNGKVSGVGAAVGAIAGLATVTPAAGFIGVGSSLILGVVTGIVTFYVVQYKGKISIRNFNLEDDALDVFAVHGVGGIIGVIGTGILASSGGLIDGSSELLINNLILVVSTIIYSLLISLWILKILDVIPGLGLRSSESEEDDGLDVSDHGEKGYIVD